MTDKQTWQEKFLKDFQVSKFSNADLQKFEDWIDQNKELIGQDEKAVPLKHYAQLCALLTKKNEEITNLQQDFENAVAECADLNIKLTKSQSILKEGKEHEL